MESQNITKEDFIRIRENLEKKNLTSEDTNILLKYLTDEAEQKEENYKEKKWLERGKWHTFILNSNHSSEKKNKTVTQEEIKISIAENIENLYHLLLENVMEVKQDNPKDKLNPLLEKYDEITNYEDSFMPYINEDVPLATDLLPEVKNQSEKIVKTFEKRLKK